MCSVNINPCNSVGINSKQEKVTTKPQSYSPIKESGADSFVSTKDAVTSKKEYNSRMAKFCKAFGLTDLADSIQAKADKAEAIRQHENFVKNMRNPRYMNEFSNVFARSIYVPERTVRERVAELEKEHGKLKYNLRCDKNHVSVGTNDYNLFVFSDGTVHKTPNYIAKGTDFSDPENLNEGHVSIDNEAKCITKEEYDNLRNVLESVHGSSYVARSVYSEERGGLVKVLRFSDFHEIVMPSLEFEKPSTEPVVAENVPSELAERFLKHKNLYGGVKSIEKTVEKNGRDRDEYLKVKYNDGTNKTFSIWHSPFTK